MAANIVGLRLITGEHVIGVVVSERDGVYTLKDPQLFQTAVNTKTGEDVVVFLPVVPFGTESDVVTFPFSSILYWYNKLDDTIIQSYNERNTKVKPATSKEMGNVLKMLKGGRNE